MARDSSIPQIAPELHCPSHDDDISFGTCLERQRNEHCGENCHVLAEIKHRRNDLELNGFQRPNSPLVELHVAGGSGGNATNNVTSTATSTDESGKVVDNAPLSDSDRHAIEDLKIDKIARRERRRLYSTIALWVTALGGPPAWHYVPSGAVASNSCCDQVQKLVEAKLPDRIQALEATQQEAAQRKIVNDEVQKAIKSLQASKPSSDIIDNDLSLPIKHYRRIP